MRAQHPPWTVARLAALLVRLKRRPTLAELKAKHGIGIRDLVRLNRRVLGTVEDTGVTQAAALAIQFGPGVAFSLAGPLLEKAASLSKAEWHLAVMGLRWTVAGPAVKSGIQELARRLDGAGPPPEREGREVFFGPPMTRAQGANLLAVIEARADGRKLRFRYEGDAEGAARVVRPLNLRKDAGEWRLLAWDEGRGDLRVFKLVHVSDAGVLPEAFEWPPGVDREEALSRDLSVYRPKGDEVRVALKIRASALRRLQRLFPRHRAPRAGDAWVKAELPSASPEWVARALLPALGSVRVLSPPGFRMAFEDEIQAVLSKY